MAAKVFPAPEKERHKPRRDTEIHDRLITQLINPERHKARRLTIVEKFVPSECLASAAFGTNKPSVQNLRLVDDQAAVGAQCAGAAELAVGGRRVQGVRERLYALHQFAPSRLDSMYH
jgi:hypothetical protein